MNLLKPFAFAAAIISTPAFAAPDPDLLSCQIGVLSNAYGGNNVIVVPQVNMGMTRLTITSPRGTGSVGLFDDGGFGVFTVIEPNQSDIFSGTADEQNTDRIFQTLKNTCYQRHHPMM